MVEPFDFFDGSTPLPKSKRLAAPTSSGPEERATTPVPARRPRRVVSRLLPADRAWLVGVEVETDTPGVRDGLADVRVLDVDAVWAQIRRCAAEVRPKPWTVELPLLGHGDGNVAAGWQRVCCGWRIVDWRATAEAVSRVEGLEWVLGQYLMGQGER